MMNAVEIMAKAIADESKLWTTGENMLNGKLQIWRSGACLYEDYNHSGVHAKFAELIKSETMRSALLALAEMELPQTALDAAGAVNDHLARQEFRAIIKALAEEGK